MRLQDIMNTGVDCVRPTDTAVFANELMWRKKMHHLLVMEDDALVGVISDTDLGGDEADEIPDNLLVRDAMTSEVVTADPNMTVDRAFNIFRERNIHCLPVLDSSDEVVGIVTYTDIQNLMERGKGQAPFDGPDAGVGRGYPPLQSQQRGTSGKGEHNHQK